MSKKLDRWRNRRLEFWTGRLPDKMARTQVLFDLDFALRNAIKCGATIDDLIAFTGLSRRRIQHRLNRHRDHKGLAVRYLEQSPFQNEWSRYIRRSYRIRDGGGIIHYDP